MTDIDWDTHSFIVCDVFVNTFILCIYLFQILPSCFLLGRPTSSAATRPTLKHLLSAARNEIQVRSVEFINFKDFKLWWIRTACWTCLHTILFLSHCSLLISLLQMGWWNCNAYQERYGKDLWYIIKLPIDCWRCCGCRQAISM